MEENALVARVMIVVVEIDMVVMKIVDFAKVV